MKDHELKGEEIFSLVPSVIVRIPRYAGFVTDPLRVEMLHCTNCKGKEDPVCAVEIENHDGCGRSFQCLSCGDLIGPKHEARPPGPVVIG